ncbi:MAG: hypothetical protein LBS39_01595 [Campylobacteraceae bacterium]|jgi:hypothetical protein|nr:hypothetical protein [Campylobacteraceae bacterium]
MSLCADYFPSNNIRDFSLVYSASMRGNVKIIGNTILGANKNGVTNAVCPDASVSNSNIDTKYWDIDGVSSTFSSSKSTLILPSDAVVKKAYLVWQGYIPDKNNNNSVRNIRLKTPTTKNNYVELKAKSDKAFDGKNGNLNWYIYKKNKSHPYYQGTIEVTDYVKQSGEYTVGNLTTQTGLISEAGTFGAWAIVVAYESKQEKLNNIAIYNGYIPMQDIYSTNSKQFSVSGFLTPTTGAVSSRFLIFTGEGDYGITGDLIRLNNTPLKNTAGETNNIFKSQITEDGALVTTKNPNCANNIGIDIHTYNIGNTGTNPQKIMTNKATSIGITLETNWMMPPSYSDTYFPGIFAFSTELYEPRVCYYIDTIVQKDDSSKIVFKDGMFVDEMSVNKDYVFNVWISNIGLNENDTNVEEAKLVQVKMQFLDPDQLSYITGSTFITNIGSDILSMSDAANDDLGEYNKNDNISTWKVGSGATRDKGGTLVPAKFNENNKKVFVKFNAKLNERESDSIDLANLLHFKASLQTATLTIEPQYAQPISQCRTLNTNATVGRAAIGTFNVVNEKFSGTTLNAKNHNHNALFTQIVNKPFDVKILSLDNSTTDEKKIIVFDEDVKLDVYVIETPDFRNCKDDACKQQKCENANNAQIVFTGNANKDGTTLIKNINITRAFKEASFKVIADNSSSCSADSFSVRPDSFKLANNFSENLVGGKTHKGSLQAQPYKKESAAQNYNQTYNNIKFVNSTIIPRSSCNTTEFNTTVNDNEFNITMSNFNNGNSNVSIIYENIGKINTLIVDKAWTDTDYDLNNNIYDCIADSASNEHNLEGKVGCNIALNTTLAFTPSSFKANFTVSDFDKEYTYISNAPIANNVDMYAKIYLSVLAVLEDNSTATNYHRNCFANDITYDIKLVNNNLTGWGSNRGNNATGRIAYFDGQNATVSSNNMGDGKGELKTDQNHFINGVATMRFGFNFNERSSNKTENPFIVNNDDLNITNIKDTDGVNGQEISQRDGKATFYYGRAHSKQNKYITHDDSVDATIYYEVYCKKILGCINSNITSFANRNSEFPDWYINTGHDATIAGNVAGFNGDKSVTFKRMPNVRNGSEVVTIEKNTKVVTSTPYTTSITIILPSWLHNEPKFEVIFDGNGGSWVGYGQTNINGDTANKTGRVVDVNPSNQRYNKIDW